MLNVTKLGHVEFEVTDLDRMTDYYTDVLGLRVTERAKDTVYLSLTVDHHAVVLKRGNQSRMTRIGLHIANADAAELAKHLDGHGLSSEIRSAPEPGIGTTVETLNPDGVMVALCKDCDVMGHRPLNRGLSPVKISHVAALCMDLEKTRKFYMDALGFRNSDQVEQAFYFLRCGADHHTINLLAGEVSTMHHLAFEMQDGAQLNTSSDMLHEKGHHVLWGPVRHSAGHNLATYHVAPEDHVIELCAELDRMSNEALGYFDPRPYHEDSPQYPKVWHGREAGMGSWGQFPPPERLGKGMAPHGDGMMDKH